MGHAYQAVGWNRQKRIYDLTVASLLGTYLAGFVILGVILFPTATAETLLIRALGSAAFLLLHVILIIGPLHRLAPITAPLLYNRRHLGVTMFVVALAHAAFTTLQFHMLGPLNPMVSILSGGGAPEGSGTVPFQLFGFVALVIIALMAATSHDFWLARLSPGTWKKLHVAVYGAYVLLIGHVSFGIMQQPGSGVWFWFTLSGIILVGSVHAAAGLKGRAEGPAPDSSSALANEGFLRVCQVDQIQEGRAKIFEMSGDRIAVFRHEGKLSAVSNTCRHQGGPLGEGRILNGNIVCPWHGYEYNPVSGCAPTPFTEKVPTFAVRILDGEVFVNPEPLAPGHAPQAAAII
ncbi:MAG: sulfoxide reductase heme-binding subunit YedZ [Rhodothermales bacterium]|jgi:sulfoxide reductase heme-binding subunit YedZ